MQAYTQQKYNPNLPGPCPAYLHTPAEPGPTPRCGETIRKDYTNLPLRQCRTARLTASPSRPLPKPASSSPGHSRPSSRGTNNPHTVLLHNAVATPGKSPLHTRYLAADAHQGQTPCLYFGLLSVLTAATPGAPADSRINALIGHTTQGALAFSSRTLRHATTDQLYATPRQAAGAVVSAPTPTHRGNHRTPPVGCQD